MVEVVQTFNGKETRTVARVRSESGAIKAVRSVEKASADWGVFLRGTEDELRAIGAYKTRCGGWLFTFAQRATKSRSSGFYDVDIECEVPPITCTEAGKMCASVAQS